MVWNIESEVISSIIVTIIIIYSRGNNTIPTLRNKVFSACLIITFIGIVSNIISTLMIYNIESIPLFLTWIVTTIYFIATPLMGAVYFYYVMAIAHDGGCNIKKMSIICFIPYAIYLFLIIINPFNGNLFELDSIMGYTRGPLIASTYIVFYVYCISCIFIVLINRIYIDASIRKILYSFPIIAVAVIFIQQLFPKHILSGSAATCALLIIYLYLQNKRITIDQLTGVSNRAAFMKMLELKIKKQTHITVVVVSLNDFKFINDKFGQRSGDLFLKIISGYICSTIKNMPIYRYSGDEFAVILEDLNGNEIELKEKLESLISNIVMRFSQPWDIKECSCLIYSTIGTVDYPNVADNIEDMINVMEYALNNFKENGKNNVVACTKEMIDTIKRKRIIIDIIKNKIESNGFEVYYQPIFSVSQNRFSAAESLCRLKDDNLGWIFPDEFIPIAEETGLIVPMSYQIFDKVCLFIKGLIEKNIDIDIITVNLSVIQFMQEDLAEKFLEIISNNKIPYEKIKFEITESVFTNNYRVIMDFMNKMNEYGIDFALDDFGTGYSNVSYVVDLPSGTIKVDKSLIWTSMTNSKCASFVASLIVAFKKLGIKIVVEGIENEEQDKFVRECGTDLIQGYMYSRPLPPEEAEKCFIEQQKILEKR